MPVDLWKLPVAPTALIKSPSFVKLLKRQCEISMEFEGSNGIVRVALTFEGIEVFKCTYPSSCTAEMINTAYGKLVRLESTPWLTQTQKVLSDRRLSRPLEELQHLMICFDDDPCYEFICTGFSVS
jgi:hypothetical protein